MSVLLALARHTVLDALRERAFLMLGIFAALMLAASRVIAPLALGEQRRVTLDLGLGLIAIFGFLLVLFLGTRMVHKEIDRKTILVLLAKPVRRGELIAGKFLGLASVLAISVAGMLALLAGILALGGHGFNGSLAVAGYYALLELLILAALAMLLTAFTSPVLAIFFLVGLYVAGHLAPSLLEAARMLGDPLAAGALRAVCAVLPRLDLYSHTLEVVHGSPAAPAQLAAATIYALLYSGAALLAGLVAFSRREFS